MTDSPIVVDRAFCASIKPGDTLIVSTDKMLTIQTRSELQKHIESAVPEGVKVLILFCCDVKVLNAS